MLKRKNDKYTWKVELRKNQLAHAYTAAVRQDYKTYRWEDLAALLVRERVEVREEILLLIAKLMEEKLVERLLEGDSVQTEYFRFKPVVRGTFSPEGEPVEKDKLQYVLSIVPTQGLKELLDNDVAYEVVAVQEQGGAYISRVEDLYTGATDGTLGCTHLARLYGNKVKCVDATGEGKGRLVLTDTQGRETDVTQIGENNPSTLTFVVPENLAPGEYSLRIETYFTSGSLLKKVRRIEYGETIRIV